MKSNEILAGLLSVELLKNKTLEERIKHLETCVSILSDENEELYKALAELQTKPKEEHTLGFHSLEKK